MLSRQSRYFSDSWVSDVNILKYSYLYTFCKSELIQKDKKEEKKEQNVMSPQYYIRKNTYLKTISDDR